MDKHRDAVIAGADYERFIAALKSRIQTARLSASRVVYREMILLYWDRPFDSRKTKIAGLGRGRSRADVQRLTAGVPGSDGFVPTQPAEHEAVLSCLRR